jgi:hypothetical protein
VTAKIYRFISYRSESCPLSLIDADDLANLTNLSGPVGALNSALGGLQGSGAAGINQLLTNINGALASLGGLGGLVAAVLNAVNGITGQGNATKPVVQQLQGSLTGLAGSVTTLQSNLSALGTLDLCRIDLQKIKDLVGLNDQAEAQLNAITAQLNGLGLNTVSGLFGQVVGTNCGPLGLLCLVNGVVGSLLQTVNTQLATQAPALIGRIQALLSPGGNLADFTNGTLGQINSLVSQINLQADDDTPPSSKRVTIAVVLDKGAGSELQEPIWMSTVVTDPNAGILG